MTCVEFGSDCLKYSSHDLSRKCQSCLVSNIVVICCLECSSHDFLDMVFMSCLEYSSHLLIRI